MTTWLDPKCPPDVRTLTMTELVEAWEKHRNSHYGMVAANEIARRCAQYPTPDSANPVRAATRVKP